MTILKDVHLNISGPISSIELVTLISNYEHALRAYIHLGQKPTKERQQKNKTKQTNKQKNNGDCCYHNGGT